MKNLLILIVVIAIFLHFYPQPEVDEFYEETMSIVLGSFGDTFDTQSKLSPKKVLSDLENDMKSFTPKERKKLLEITESRADIKTFYDSKCTAKKRERAFRKNVQGRICTVIARYGNLL